MQPAEGTRVQQYTLPAIDHDGKTIMDSLKIALYLDEKFPDAPRLIPEGTLPLYRALQSYTALSITTHVFPLLLPRVIAFLDDRGAEYFRRTREEAVGYTITDAINQNEAKVNECWEKATAGLKMVNQMLDDNPGGPYILGKERSYADMHLVSFLEWWKQCGDDIYERGVSIAPNLKRLYEACSDLNE